MKRLSVRLPEPAMRRIKSLSALRGVSLQEAVQQALDAWASQPQPAETHALDQPPGSLAGVGLEKKRPTKRAAAAQPNRRRPAGEGSSLTPGGGQPENLEGAALEWFRRAGTLD
jgi:Ribbon-helix-helix protein, copG family